ADKVVFAGGGVSRRESVGNALALLAARETAPSHIMVHDSARPMLPADVIDRLVAALEEGDAAAMPVLPVVDTLVEARDDLSGDTADRARLRRVQTPQAFALDVLRAAHGAWAGPDEPT